MWIVPFYKPPVIQTPTWADRVSIESLERRMATKTPQKGPFLKHKGHKCGFVHSVSFESNLKVGDFYSSQQKYNNNQWMKTYLDTILPKSSGEGRSQRQWWGGVIWRFCYKLFKSLIIPYTSVKCNNLFKFILKKENAVTSPR